MTARMILHLHVEFGALILDFQGGREQVAEVAAELSTSSLGVTVTVDDRVTTRMPKLPCSWLWDEPCGNRTSISHSTRTGPARGRSALFSEVDPRKGER